MSLPVSLQPHGVSLDPSWRLMTEARPSDMMQWAKQYTFGNEATFNGELEEYLPANVYIDGTTGDLILEGRNTGGGDPTLDGGKYTSGTVQSWNALSFKYGFIEGKIKMPAGKGVWPAFWMLLTSYNSSDEIDIVEIFENATNLNRGIHYENPPGTKHSDGGATTVADMSAGYHYYQLAWTPTSITWYFDGAQLFQVTNATEFPHDVMYLLLNVALGGVVTTGAPLDSQFPIRMYVEYVRIWQRQTPDYVFQPTPQAPSFKNYLAALLNYAPHYLYRGDEASGTTAVDQSGYGNNGTYNGGYTLNQAGLLIGDADKAVKFDGSTGYIATPFDPTGLTRLSIISTFEMPGAVIANDGRFIASSHTDQNNNGFQMVIRANGVGGLVSVGYGTNRIDCFWTLANSALLLANTVYHYGFSYDGQYIHVYVNGVLVGTASSSGQNAISSSGFNVNIGRGPYGNDYTGVIMKDTAIYPNLVLGAGDFLSLYNRATTAPARSSIVALSDAPRATLALSDSSNF